MTRLDPDYQRNRRHRLRAEGKCVVCATPSETYKCRPCYEKKYARHRPHPERPVRPYRRRSRPLLASLCPVCAIRADACGCLWKAPHRAGFQPLAEIAAFSRRDGLRRTEPALEGRG